MKEDEIHDAFQSELLCSLMDRLIRMEATLWSLSLEVIDEDKRERFQAAQEYMHDEILKSSGQEDRQKHLAILLQASVDKHGPSQREARRRRTKPDLDFPDL